MIISRGRNYIFVHIPKTGGTSMALALEARAMKDDLMLGDTPKALKRRRKVADVQTRGRLWKHSTLADIDGLVSVPELDDLFCFTMVRNPWDRVVSYYHWLRVQTFQHPAVRRASSLPFEEFVRDPATIQSLQANPASAYVTDVAGQQRCAAFIRLEHLENDLAPLEAHLGFRLDMPKVNQSQREAGWRQFYSNESQKVVENACAEDISRFGYSFKD